MSRETGCAEVEALEISLLKPEVRQSRERLERLLADDFLEIGASGREWRKTEIICALLDASDDAIEFDSMASKFIGENVVLVTYRSRRLQSPDRNDAIRSSIWRRRNNEWQLVFHQGTKTHSQQAARGA